MTYRGDAWSVSGTSGIPSGFFRGRAARGLRRIVKKEEAHDLAVEVRVPGQVRAPVGRGQKVGSIVLLRGGHEIARVDVVAPRDIESVGLLEKLW